MSDHDLPITALTRRRHRRAVAELVAAERRRAGLPALRRSAALRMSARAWSRTMIRRSRFGHGKFRRRALRFPFAAASVGTSWSVAENVATGSGDASTPRAIVAAWMGSPPHRENVLGHWHFGAVWCEADTPTPGRQPDGVTVVQHFGWRGRRRRG